MTDVTRPCGSCGYDLRSLRGNLCPECGKQIVDYGAREGVAIMLDEFLDGRVTGSTVVGSWPRETADRTLRRAGDEVSALLEEFAMQRFGDDCPKARQVRALLGRWTVFLRADRELDMAAPRRNRTRAYEVFLVAQIVILVGALVFGTWLRRTIGLQPLLLVLLVVAAAQVPHVIRWVTGARTWPTTEAGVRARESLESDVYPFRLAGDYQTAVRELSERRR